MSFVTIRKCIELRKSWRDRLICELERFSICIASIVEQAMAIELCSNYVLC